MALKVKQSELFKGYTFLNVSMYHLGTGQTRYTVVPANMHPKMKLLDTAQCSGVHCLVTAGAGPHMTCEHDDGRDAGTAAGADTANTFYAWTLSTTKGDDVFEADEPVIVFAATAGGAATDAVVVNLHFQVLQDD